MNQILNPAVVFRKRSGWEASDLGVFLWRSNCFPILFFTAIPALFLVAVNIIIPRLGIEWLSKTAILFIWWIKPLLDRFSLHVVSVRFFEPVNSSDSSFRRLFRGLGKTIKTALPGDLLWRRLSPFRSAAMPLRVLERLKGNNYKRRKQLLARNGLGFGLPLTFICIGMGTALNAGELVFLNSVFNMINNTSSNIFDFFNEHNLFVSSLYLANEILVETLYVCMGFSLYINSRVETEGWDIELLFKTLVEKKSFKPAHKHRSAVTFAMPVLALFFLFAPCRGYTLDTVSPALPEQELTVQKKQNYELLKPTPVSRDAKDRLSVILEDPKFGTEKESWKIQFKQKRENRLDSIKAPSIASAFREIAGQLLRVSAAASIVTVLGLAMFFTYRYRNRLFPKSAAVKNSIDNPFREDCHILLQQAEACHKKGKIREAWALCFKAFISVFDKFWFVPFPPEATEYESLALVRKNYASPSPDSANNIKNFEDFISRWITFAYGGQEPEAGSFEQAVASCKTLLEYRENGA